MARNAKVRPSQPVVTLDNFLAVLAAGLVMARTNPDALPGMHETRGNPITLGPRVLSSTDWSAKQIANAKAGATNWAARTLTPRKDPLKAALAANTKYKNKVQEALANDSFAKGIAKADEAEMYNTIRATGASGFTSGIDRRVGKINKAVVNLQPQVLALANAIDGMAQDTDDQRAQRLLAARAGMIAIGKANKG